MLLPGVGALPDQASLIVTPGDVWSMSALVNDSASSSGSSSGSSGGSSAAEGVVRRVLKAGGAGGGGGGAAAASYADFAIRDEGVWAWLWIVQAIALLLMMLHLAHTFFMPFQDLYILLCTISKMLTNDLATFMCAFLWFLVASYVALFTLYPRSGDAALPQVGQFNMHTSAICTCRRAPEPIRPPKNTPLPTSQTYRPATRSQAQPHTSEHHSADLAQLPSSTSPFSARRSALSCCPRHGWQWAGGRC